MKMIRTQKDVLKLIRRVEKIGTDSRMKAFRTSLKIANYYAKLDKRQ